MQQKVAAKPEMVLPDISRMNKRSLLRTAYGLLNGVNVAYISGCGTCRALIPL